MFRVRLVYLISAAMLVGVMGAVAAQARIEWRSGAAEIERTDPAAMVVAVQSLAARPDARHVTVQFETLPTMEIRAELESLGLVLLGYLGDRTYFAALDIQMLDADALAASGVLTAVRSIETEWKLHPALAAGEIPPWAIVDRRSAENSVVAAYVLFHADVALVPDAVVLCEKYAGKVRAVLHAAHGCVIEAPVSALLALAGEDAVLWVEPPLPLLSPTNDSNRQLVQADQANAPPYDLDGAGVSVLIYDAGTARVAHEDFGGRLTKQDDTPRQEHSTHVAGTIGGDGSASGGLYAGMAPGVTMESYGLQFSYGGSFLYMNSGDLEDDFADAINNHGVHIANCSLGSNVAQYGFPCEWEGNYGATSAAIDSIIVGAFGDPFRIVWSNGNERAYGTCGSFYGTIAPPAGAKNHISVGAVNSNDDSMTYFSSWGPTDDGRIKPDVVAPGCETEPEAGHVCGESSPETDPGCGVISCSAEDNQAYAVMCGASMAAPTVTGSLALLLQDFQIQYPERPLPLNSTLKALLAHTAADLGAPGPDYQHGYGSVRIRDAIDLMRQDQFVEQSLEHGGAAERYIRVDSSDSLLTLTLAWDDQPALPNVTPALVNDVDLRVFDPLDARHYPWTLNPDDPAANATQTTDDRVNNVEQVQVQNPEPGLWRVEVFGHAIPQGPQSFSLCSSHPLHSHGITQAISRAWTVCQSFEGDLDCDCSVNLNDLARMLGFWGATAGGFYDEGDIDLDGDLDFDDLATLLAMYGSLCE